MGAVESSTTPKPYPLCPQPASSPGARACFFHPPTPGRDACVGQGKEDARSGLEKARGSLQIDWFLPCQLHRPRLVVGDVQDRRHLEQLEDVVDHRRQGVNDQLAPRLAETAVA